MIWSRGRAKASTTSCTGWCGISLPRPPSFPKLFPAARTNCPTAVCKPTGTPDKEGTSGIDLPALPRASHHYAFELFSSDQKLDLPDTATRADAMKAIDGHILA